MSNINYSRRNFLKKNSLICAGTILSGGSYPATHLKSVQQKASTVTKLYPTISHFGGGDDMPDDLFGDLTLIRKGAADMTRGRGTTSIEPITSINDWEVKANALRKIYMMMLGSPPAGIDCDLSIKIEKITEYDGYSELRVSYLLSPGERVASIMLIPKGVKFPCPAILTIHPTTQLGKEQTVGRGDSEDGKLTAKAYNRAYGLHLVERGYITFSPDLLGAGERIFPGLSSFDNQPFIDAHPNWSGTGKDIRDLQLALDVMQSFTEVDSDRIASIGHSQGAGITCNLSSLDKRIKVGVANCGVWPSTIKNNPFTAARTDWWTGTPALRPFFHAGKPTPIDAHERLALSAPRPFLNIAALNDSGFKIADEPFTRRAWDNLKSNVKKIYALYGAEDKFENILHLEGHDFHDKYRAIAYEFIDKHLGR